MNSLPFSNHSPRTYPEFRPTCPERDPTISKTKMRISNNDDQRKQCLKKTLRNRVAHAFQRRREGNAAEVDTASISESECSTLIEFMIDDAGSNLSTSPTEVDLIVASERSVGIAEPQEAISRQLSSSAEDESDLLDEEDCTWVMPRTGSSSNSRPSQQRFSLFGKRPRPRSSTNGLEPELLDPEERSWM